ncbi:MAG: C40 family peptidase [Gemmatimonadota bacterium]
MSGSNWEERSTELGARHVPDPRLGVWDITVDRTPNGEVHLSGATTSAAGLEELRAKAADHTRVDVQLLPEPALKGSIRAVAHRSLAYLRRDPSHTGEMVSQMIMGEEALALRRSGDWLQVQTGDSYVAWVHHGACLLSDPGDPGEYRGRLAGNRFREGSWIVVARAAVARQAPDLEAPIVADLVQGAIVDARARDDALELMLPDGTRGWVEPKAAVRCDHLNDVYPHDGSAIVAHASTFMGLPYLWGGTSEKGFDCSGLVQRVYGLHGVYLPRDADQQYAIGAPIKPGAGWGAIRDGDLAFFAEPPGERVTHVGILTTGGQMVHASTTRNGVAWDTLNPADPMQSEFGNRLASWLVGVRRVLEA